MICEKCDKQCPKLWIDKEQLLVCIHCHPHANDSLMSINRQYTTISNDFYTAVFKDVGFGRLAVNIKNNIFILKEY